MRVPTYLDRYPAKMVSRLAQLVVRRYVRSSQNRAPVRLLDPFCGSGAVLVAAQLSKISATGIDINPYGALLSGVKMEGFDTARAVRLADRVVSVARASSDQFAMELPFKSYWFTPLTLEKIERIRSAAKRLDLSESREGRAVLVCFALSMRLCSRADQRSPKLFISREARHSRSRRHFDPYVFLKTTIREFAAVFGGPRSGCDHLVFASDIVHDYCLSERIGLYSHVVTSPPYINAQDYYRSCKLELFALEGLLQFRVRSIRDRFVGSERGSNISVTPRWQRSINREVAPEVVEIESKSRHLAGVVHRYLYDMSAALETTAGCLGQDGELILVCGDNLVGGVRICTWRALRMLLERCGFSMYDSFRDRIQNRVLPPHRRGHKGLIKEEVVSAYRRI